MVICKTPPLPRTASADFGEVAQTQLDGAFGAKAFAAPRGGVGDRLIEGSSSISRSSRPGQKDCRVSLWCAPALRSVAQIGQKCQHGLERLARKYKPNDGIRQHH
jgi:hypothetical protein